MNPPSFWRNSGDDILDSAVYGNQMTGAQALSDYEGQTLNNTSKSHVPDRNLTSGQPVSKSYNWQFSSKYYASIIIYDRSVDKIAHWVDTKIVYLGSNHTM